MKNTILGTILLPKKNRTHSTPSIRMKNGSAVAIKNYLYGDNRLEMIRKYFCRSETIKAIGRGRQIWDQNKSIFLFSKESMGGDVEVTKLFTHEDVFGKKKKYAGGISTLNSIVKIRRVIL